MMYREFSIAETLSLLDQTMSGVLVYDRNKRLVYKNSSSLRLLRLEETSPLLERFDECRYFDKDGNYLDPEQYPLSRAIREARSIENEIIGYRRGGVERWLLCSACPLVLPDADSDLILVSFIDYTTLREAQGKLELYLKDASSEVDSRDRLLLAANVFTSVSEGITITDAKGDILIVNQAFSDITGYGPDEVIGRNPRILKSEHHDHEFYAGMWRSLTEEGSWQGEIINRRKDGTIYPEWLSITAVRDAAGFVSHYVAVFSDRSDMKAREDEINKLYYIDTLTDLPNRFLFLDRVGESIRMSEREGKKLAILYFDINNFKYINSKFGYLAGDAIIREAGARIRAALRKADTVARLGGDEFAILLPNVDRAECAMRAGKNVLDALQQPYEARGQQLFVSASGGIALWPSDGAEPGELIANAIIAAKDPKRSDVDNPQLYMASIGERVKLRLDLESKLRHAIEREEFELYYQAKVRTGDRSIAGMEALVRWRGEDGRLISPVDFIPLAEESGLIVPLGKWILFKALQATKTWRDKGHDLVVSVNLSAHQFKDRQLETMILRALQDLAYPPSALDLEITESVAMSDIALTIKVMKHLSESGIHFSLDDFGTGYSSFSYLTKLPLQWLKIDQSFVRGIGPEGKTENAIVKAVVSMAKSLDLGTIAEGCETVGQYKVLREFGCDQIQGFIFSKPVPENEFEALLGKAPLPDPMAYEPDRDR
jgi:diguanylate cyclase (GGDEF)-like protein/PAS domain S-box-containing protein